MGRALALLTLLVLSAALAETITISTPPGDETSRLELRNLTLPDGSVVQYYIIEGSPVTLRVGERQEVEAERVEVDLTNRVLRIIGFGTIRTGSETVSGENLSLDLADETFSGRDVLIVTEAIDVLGAEASRVPGQVSVLGGAFSPCARCNQQTEDFGFRAERLELYPGDRLVAFGVTVVVRALPVFFLPILVVPLAPPERQPRLAVTRGTRTSRAEIALDWPYVSGPTALGTFSVRYYADVAVGEGNFVTNGLFGGRTRVSYLGGGVDHRFYTDTGAGRFEFFYTPGFVTYDSALEPDGKTRDQFLVRFRYDTAPELSGVPQVSVNVERDDARAERIVEYGVRLENTSDGIRGVFSSQGFIDLEPREGPSAPSYGEPSRTLARLELTPEAERFSIGPFDLSGLGLDLGVFEGRASPSAQRFGVVSALRLVERHRLTLTPVALWRGLELSGFSDFRGQYYSLGQRLVDWDTELSASQRFGFGALNLRFSRDINEGETPFRFDAIGLGNVIGLAADLQLTPAPWLRLATSGSYTFLDERRPDLEGFGPLTSRLELFGNLGWLGVSVENRYDIKEGDPGTLVTTLSLRSPEPRLAASLSYSVVQDLLVTPDRVGGGYRDDSGVAAELRFGLPPGLDFSLAGGYTFEPPLPEAPGEVRDFWKPLTLELTVGSLQQGDPAPGLQLGYERDLNRGEPRRFSVNATATVEPFELDLAQTFDFANARLSESTFGVTWRGVARFELTGIPIIPPRTVGLELAGAQSYGVNLLEDRADGGAARWRLSYSTIFDPTFTNLEGGQGRYRGSQLSARVNLNEAQLGGVYYRLDLASTVLLADDARRLSYLANTDLAFFVDLYSTVGLQATLRYNAFAGPAATEVERATLNLDNVAATVKLFDQLYLSAILEQEQWTLKSPSVTEDAFNFQPVFQVVWNRCCWALYGSWNTATGAISITLTTPGAERGFRQEFQTPLTLPGRGP